MGTRYDNTEMRLDAAESIWFSRQLESIDTRLYEQQFPEYKARSIVPTITGVSEAASAYTYRLVSSFGEAKPIANMATDLPAADVAGEEKAQVIKTVASSFHYDFLELKEAARLNTPLDEMKARAARRAVEELVDRYLSLGNTTLGLTGILSIASGTTPFTLSTKTGGGLTWANATGQEMADDMIAIAAAINAASFGAISRVKIYLPIAQYNRAARTRLGSVSDTTALQFALGNPLVASVEHWYRCAGAGAGATDRMLALAADRTEEVVGALVPMEFTRMPVQEKDLVFKVPCVARVGGVVPRYSYGISYGDGI